MTTVPPADIAPAEPRTPAPPPVSKRAEPTSPFTALLFKEARESGMFVLVVWGVVSFLVTYIYVMLMSTKSSVSNIPSFILMHPGMNALFPLATGILGAVLGGVVLYRSQNSFDTWAFLTHRPLSRSRLFVYKTLVGLLTYAVAVGVPMLIYLWWAIMEPRATPWFDWRMLLPITADFLVGIVTFLASGLCAQRDARWYGTRLVPLLLAVGVVILTMRLPQFWMVVTLDLIAVGLLATASWGTALAHGQISATPVIARVCLRLSMFLGLLFPGYVICVISIEWLGYISQYSYGGKPFILRDPIMLNDGSMALREQTYHPRSGYVSEESTHYLTLSGEPIPSPELTTWVAAATIDLAARPSGSAGFYRSLNSIITPVQSVGAGPLPLELTTPNWYYLRQRQTVEQLTDDYRRRVRSLGPSGFREGTEQPEAFPGADSSPFVTPHAYYYLSTDAADVVKKITFPDEELLNVQSLNFQQPASRQINSISPYVFITDKHIYIENSEFAGHSAVLALKESPTARSINLYRHEDGNYSLRYSATRQRMSMIFDLFDEHGTLLRSTEVNLQDEPLHTGLISGYNPTPAYQKLEVGMLMSAGMPVALMPFADGMTSDRQMNNTSVISDPLTWGITFVNVFSATGIALLLRRYPLSLPVKLLWIAALLLLGPMLLIVFAGSYAWPVRVACPACGKYRPVARNLCPHCAAPFSPPALNGTEIFA